MSCGACTRVRAHLPAAIRKRLEEVERRIEAKRTRGRVEIKYTTKPPTARADSPQHLPGILPGGDGAGEAGP